MLLDQSEITLSKGESFTLAVTVLPDIVSDKNVRWVSSHPSRVSVVDGVVTALIEEGTAMITVSVGGKTAHCVVTIVKKVIAVTSVEIDQSSLDLLEGEVASLVAAVIPDDATDQTVIWESSDINVATVDKMGKVKAVSEGNAVIKASCGDKYDTCEIIVRKKDVPVVAILLDRRELSLGIDESVALVATVTPDDATDKKLLWESSDVTVAVVDQEGRVTAVASGKAVITVSAGGKSATCDVIVKSPAGYENEELEREEYGF